MATVSELIDQVLRRLDEQNVSAPVHWTRPEILVYVNEFLSETNLIAWEFQSTEGITFDSANNVYDTPTAILAPLSVRSPNYLRRQSADDIDREARWESASEKRLKIRTWASLGLNKILIHPRPLGNVSAHVEGIVEHTAVTDSATALPIRAEYESAAEDYCVERAKFKDGPSELEQAGPLYRSYLDKVQLVSGRNVVRMYPRFSSGVIADDNLREQVEEGSKQDGH